MSSSLFKSNCFGESQLLTQFIMARLKMALYRTLSLGTAKWAFGHLKNEYRTTYVTEQDVVYCEKHVSKHR